MSYRIKLLSPYFGELPEWYDQYEPPVGYDFLLDQDLEGFKKRVKDVLGIDCPIEWGSTKVSDYRCALGQRDWHWKQSQQGTSGHYYQQ